MLSSEFETLCNFINELKAAFKKEYGMQSAPSVLNPEGRASQGQGDDEGASDEEPGNQQTHLMMSLVKMSD